MTDDLAAARRRRDLLAIAALAERHGHHDLASTLRQQAASPESRRPPLGNPDPATAEYLHQRQAIWSAFFACNARKHPGHSDLTCPDFPPFPGAMSDAQARAEFGPGADDPVDDAAP
jgi:hypothetical protein